MKWQQKYRISPSTSSSLLFISVSCLLINARRYIYFGFHIMTSHLVSVPLFKVTGVWYTIARLSVNDTNLPVLRWVFLHFQLFCIESFGFPNLFCMVFLINFVWFCTKVSKKMMGRYENILADSHCKNSIATS